MWSKKELIDKQARVWVLMGQGATLQAACDSVEVSRTTGRHWRQATGGQVPRKKPEPSGRYLSLEDRLQIADLQLAREGAGHRHGPAPGSLDGQPGVAPQRTQARRAGTNQVRPVRGAEAD